MQKVSKLIKSTLNGTYTLSIRIGENEFEDQLRSFFDNVNSQVDFVCNMLKKDPYLKEGFNAIGFSQGSQFLRAYVQRCNNPPVRSLISLGGQHQGVYGLPRCPGDSIEFCDRMRELLSFGAYIPWIQKSVVQAQYWHDPLDQESYQKNNIFLADINNEGLHKNYTYKKNLISLKNFVLVKFKNDNMVQPAESQWFEFYNLNKSIVPLRESSIYLEDRIGLKILDETNRLHLLEVDGDHLQFTDEWFVQNIIIKFLK